MCVCVIASWCECKGAKGFLVVSKIPNHQGAIGKELPPGFPSTS